MIKLASTEFEMRFLRSEGNKERNHGASAYPIRPRGDRRRTGLHGGEEDLFERFTIAMRARDIQTDDILHRFHKKESVEQ